jgi:hypothetical protein
MIDCRHHDVLKPRLAAAGALLIGAIGLGGCAVLSDSAAYVAFVDPAKYAVYDCKRIDVDRKALAARTVELKGLMAKAEAGVGGVVIADVAYGNDLLTVRSQAKLAEQAWRDNKCTDADVAAAVAATPAAASTNPAGPACGSPRSANAPRSSGAVY